MTLGNQARRLGGVIAGLLLLAGCSGPAGIETQTDNSALVACLDQAGLSLDGAEDWSATEERRFMSKPAVLDCAVSEMGPGESLDGAMRSAFEDASPTTVVKVLTGFVRSRDVPVEDQAEDVGHLLGALDPDEFDPGNATFPVRVQLAWEIYRRAKGSVPEYDRWLDEHPDGRATDETPDVPFLMDMETAAAGTPESELSVAVDDIERVIDKAQEGDLE